MDFSIKRNYAGNEKPFFQQVLGNVLTEWRISDDHNFIVKEYTPLEVTATTPSAGTFFIGGLETTRDELADLAGQVSEHNAANPRRNRIADITKRIMRKRELHAAAITAAVGWKKKGIKLPKYTPDQRRVLYLPKAVAMEGPDGKLRIVGVKQYGHN